MRDPGKTKKLTRSPPSISDLKEELKKRLAHECPLANLNLLLFFSVPRMRWAVSTECSTGGEDTSSRRPRHPAHPCSSSRRTCPSTSPLVRNMSRIELETFQEHCYASRCIIFRARFFFIFYCAFSYLHQLIKFVPIKLLLIL